jgi:hypothetical protein
MIEILKSLKIDDDFQMLLFEKLIGSKKNPLTIYEFKKEFRLCIERIFLTSETDENGNLYEEKALKVSR